MRKFCKSRNAPLFSGARYGMIILSLAYEVYVFSPKYNIPESIGKRVWNTMNREYTEKLFDYLPVEYRQKILRSKIKGSIPGFRRLNLAPLAILKNTLKSNEKIAIQFLNAVADLYGCSSEQYADEHQFPELSYTNFWGLFARTCETLDNSPESCKILEDMMQRYEQLATADLPNGTGEAATPPAVSENLDPEAADRQTCGQPNTDAAEKKEVYMPDFTQYIGYVQETNGYYNFWPVCVVCNGSIEPFKTSQEEFPELGNVNLSSTPWDYVRKRCSNGEILVITLSSSDLIENIRQDGYFQRTNYKINFNQLERDGQIKRLKDIGMYPVLHPLAPIDFTKKAIAVKEKYVDTKDLCLIEESNILYGPYQVSVDEDNQAWVNINSAKGSIVTGFCSKNGKIDYTEIDIDIPGYPHIITYNICLDENFISQSIDKITDQDLLQIFQRSLSERKDSEAFQITSASVERYAASAFYGLPDNIIAKRVQRLKALLEDQFRQEEVQKEVAEFVSDLLYKFGDSEYFSNLLERILDNSNLAQKIQSFAITKQRVSDMQQQYEEIKRKCDQERTRLDTEARDREAQISAMAENTSETIRELTSQKDRLLQEVEQLKSQKAGLETVIELDHERERLEIINDSLRDTERKLRAKGDEAVTVLQKKLQQATTNAVDTAFEGRIADQIFQAAAGWNKNNQDEILKRIASQLVDTQRTYVLVGDELVEYLLASVKRYRPAYTRNEILNIFISLSQNFLTVFSGEPGTGKTSICNIVAHILGTSQVPTFAQGGEGVELSRYVPISIERGWTSKRDFIGYYNPLSQSFEQANKHLYDGLRLLDAEGERSRYPYIVLLDEANLSPIEYYWADFMNVCDSDSRFNKITLGNDIQLKIPPTLRFVATINNDDTTERLSPRLIDRATLIRLPDVPYKKIEDEDLTDTSFVNPVEWSALQAVFAPDTSLELDTMPSEIYKDICILFRENMKLSVSPRVDRAIRRYWAAAKNLFESESGNDTTIVALDYAVAQKLLPKINGSGKAYSEFLSKFQELCEKSNLEKSRRLLTNIIKRGETSMGYYQYF